MIRSLLLTMILLFVMTGCEVGGPVPQPPTNDGGVSQPKEAPKSGDKK